MMRERRRNVRDVRRANRTLLLHQLYFHGPQSRQDLIQASGLSSASVSNLVAELLDDGVVIEAGRVPSDGGSPRTLLRVDSARWHVVGVDIGETKILLQRFDLALHEQASMEMPLNGPFPEPQKVISELASGLAELTAGCEQQILGVGIGAPGIVVQQPYAVVHRQSAGWDAVPLEEQLRAHTQLPLFVDTTANTAGQAEMWFGAGRDSDRAVFLLIGSHIAAAFFADDAPPHSLTVSSGEWGHTSLHLDGRPCRCGARGCLEAYISAEAVIARYHEAEGTPEPGPEDLEPRLQHIMRLAQHDHSNKGTAARHVLEQTARYIGVGIANLVNLLNPQRVIIGGWAGLLLAHTLMPRIRAAARDHTLRLPFSQMVIEPGVLASGAAARGAAALPVARLLATGGTTSPATLQRSSPQWMPPDAHPGDRGAIHVCSDPTLERVASTPGPPFWRSS
jgi:predicted NBD/HSP70 family sugar kinase